MVSVVIPSYNRKDILVKCLNALFEQDYPKEDFEIIVIDDGSTDGTELTIKNIIEKSPIRLRYFRQENKGPAAARNLGIINSMGNIIIFIGDDIIAIPVLIAEHSRYHSRYPGNNVAVLGYVTWDRSLKVTSFMQFLEHGVQFNYNSIRYNTDIGFNYFVSSNISLKKDFLVKSGGFDEDFKFAVFEDIELGYRLKRHGMLLKFNPKAIGYHFHPVNIISYAKRQYLAGRSATLLIKKHPELKNIVQQDMSLVDTLFIGIKFMPALFILPIAIVMKNRFLLNKTYGVILVFFKLLGMIKGE